MQNGLYRASFKTPMGEGFGVVVLTDGTLQGGDTMMYYQGNYSETGDQFTASVEVDAHSTVPGMSSVFGPGRNRVHIDLKGHSSGDSATAQGSSPQAPGVSFTVTLNRLA